MGTARQPPALRRRRRRSYSPAVALRAQHILHLHDLDHRKRLAGPAVTDHLARDSEVILFESAERGHSTGTVPETIGGMVVHALAFLGGLGLEVCDVLGFSLGGMVAQGWRLDSLSNICRYRAKRLCKSKSRTWRNW
jgi:hypothetical protein